MAQVYAVDRGCSLYIHIELLDILSVVQVMHGFELVNFVVLTDWALGSEQEHSPAYHLVSHLELLAIVLIVQAQHFEREHWQLPNLSLEVPNLAGRLQRPLEQRFQDRSLQ